MRFTVGVATPWATSMRSRWMAKRTSAVSGSSVTWPMSGSSDPAAPATRSMRPCSSSASTTMAPSAWRKRPAYLATWSTMRSSWIDSERT